MKDGYLIVGDHYLGVTTAGRGTLVVPAYCEPPAVRREGQHADGVLGWHAPVHLLQCGVELEDLKAAVGEANRQMLAAGRKRHGARLSSRFQHFDDLHEHKTRLWTQHRCMVHSGALLWCNLMWTQALWCDLMWTQGLWCNLKLMRPSGHESCMDPADHKNCMEVAT